MDKPHGPVKFSYIEKEQLPANAQQVEIYMIPGDSRIFFVPIGEEEGKLENEMKILGIL